MGGGDSGSWVLVSCCSFLYVFLACIQGMCEKSFNFYVKRKIFYKTAYVVGHMWTSLIVNLVTVVLLPGKKILGAYLLVKSFQILGGLMIRRR